MTTRNRRRVSCVIPFCQRSTTQTQWHRDHPEHAEWLCGKHFKLIPRRFRLALIRRRLKDDAYVSKAQERLWSWVKNRCMEAAF
jgi:hypothetical protein